MHFENTDGIKKDSEFRRVYKHGKSFANRYLVIYVLKNRLGTSRVGISISKKVGNAVTRNRIRRLIKENYRLNIDEKIKPGYDIVFIARVSSSNAGFEEIDKSIKQLAKKSGILK